MSITAIIVCVVIYAVSAFCIYAIFRVGARGEWEDDSR